MAAGKAGDRISKAPHGVIEGLSAFNGWPNDVGVSTFTL